MYLMLIRPVTCLQSLATKPVDLKHKMIGMKHNVSVSST